MIFSIRKKIFLSLFVVNFFISGLISFTLFKVSTDSFLLNFKETKLSIARATAELIEEGIVINWNKYSDTESAEYLKLQRIIQTIWSHEDKASFMYMVKYSEAEDKFTYLISNAFDQDIAWIEFKDVGFWVSIDENKKLFVTYLEKKYYSDFDIQFDKKIFRASLKNNIFKIQDEEIFSVESEIPLKLKIKDVTIDKKNTFTSKFEFKIHTKQYEANITFSEKNTAYAKPGEVFFELLDVKEKMKEVFRSGKEHYDEKFTKTIYGNYLLITMPVQNKDGKVFALLCYDFPEYRVNQFKDKLKSTSRVVFFISFAVIFILSLIIPYFFNSSIEKLIAATGKISRQDYSHKINIHSGDEFQILAESFNNMSRALAESKLKLENHAEDLEIQVKQRTEELVRAKLVAEEAVRVKSDFLAVMSHEIRTPMNGVLGLSRLLAISDLNSEQKEYVKLINESGELLLSIINDILDISKIDSGRTELEKTLFPIRETVNSAYGILSAKIQEKNLKVEINFDPDIPDFVFGCELRYKQILINIFGNAIKFTDLGFIKIKLTIEKISPTEIWIQTEIEDSGLGIEDSLKPQLFQPFTQADTSLKRKYGGTGLGLAISKKLVDLLSGTISYESRFGIGSIFKFTIPFTKKITAKPEKKTLPTQDGSPKKLNLADQIPISILVVEDNEINQKLILKILSNLGYTEIGRAHV